MAINPRIALSQKTVQDLAMNEGLPRYHLDTIVGIALSRPSDGSTNLNWHEETSVDGTKKFWFSNGDVFDIEEELKKGEYPFRLRMGVMGNKKCSIGPFHSLASAQEAANRIWNHMRRGNILHTQVAGGGFVGVASRVLFPNL
jgi:hypothetical protein